MTDKEKVANEIDIYAEEFVNNLLNAYQGFACDMVSWQELLDIASTTIYLRLGNIKNFNEEEE